MSEWEDQNGREEENRRWGCHQVDEREGSKQSWNFITEARIGNNQKDIWTAFLTDGKQSQ